MSGRPAVIRQRDCKQIINAATKAGAKKVEFRVGGVTAVATLLFPVSRRAMENSRSGHRGLCYCV